MLEKSAQDVFCDVLLEIVIKELLLRRSASKNEVAFELAVCQLVDSAHWTALAKNCSCTAEKHSGFLQKNLHRASSPTSC